MLGFKDARCLLSGRIRWGRGSAVDGALVEGGRESVSGVMLLKGGEGCCDSRDWSYEVCVISGSNWVHGRVRSSDGLKWILEHQCEEEGPEGVPWSTHLWEGK
jgi:hypothetical protein